MTELSLKVMIKPYHGRRTTSFLGQLSSSKNNSTYPRGLKSMSTRIFLQGRD